MSYTSELFDELTAAGITGRLRRRIVAEIDDHLACDPAAELGAPPMLARQFADELGTSRARRTGVVSFAALALAGLLFGIAFASAPGKVFAGIPPGASWVARFATVVGTLAPQVAFVAGGLALLRALRRRRAGVIASAEARVILRRSAVGVVAGMASMTALGVLAIELRHNLPGWWVTMTEVFAVVGVIALLGAVPALLSARRVRPVAPGAAGDLFDDLGPSWTPAFLRGRPWRLALLVAGVVAVVIALVGVQASDGYDGAIRGIMDALACLLGFATLGRYLGLWAPAEPTP